MGAARRDREREGEKADMYCGCLMTGKEEKKSSEREKCGGRGAQTERENPGRGEVRECWEGRETA